LERKTGELIECQPYVVMLRRIVAMLRGDDGKVSALQCLMMKENPRLSLRTDEGFYCWLLCLLLFFIADFYYW